MPNKCDALIKTSQMIRAGSLDRAGFRQAWKSKYGAGLPDSALDSLYTVGAEHAAHYQRIDAAIKATVAARNANVANLGVTHPVDAFFGGLKLMFVSSVGTMLRNAVGNAVQMGKYSLEKGLRAGFDRIIGLRTGVVTEDFGLYSNKARMAMFAETKDKSLQEWESIWKTGMASENLTKLDAYKPMNMQWVHGQKIADGINWVFNSLGKVQSSQDVPFSQAMYVRSVWMQTNLEAKRLTKLAAAQGKTFEEVAGKGFVTADDWKAAQLANPSEDVLFQAAIDSEVWTFNSPNWLNTKVQGIKSDNRIAAVGINIFAPFIKIPTNVGSEILQHVGGSVSAIHDIAKLWDGELMRTNPREAIRIQKRAARAMSSQTVGVGLIGMGWVLHKKGLLSSDHSATAEGRDTAEATGQGPMALRIGDTWVQLGGIHPYFNVIALGGSLAENFEFQFKDQEKLRDDLDQMGYTEDPNADSYTDRATSIARGVVGVGAETLLDQPLAKSTQDAVKSLRDGDSVLQFGTNYLGGMVPPMVRELSQALGGDGVKRMTDDLSVRDAALQKMPFARHGLAPRVDSLGKEVKDVTGPKVYDIFKSSPDPSQSSDPVVAFIARRGLKVAKVPRAEGESAMEYSARLKFVGGRVYDAIKEYVSEGATWDDDARKEVQLIIARTRSGSNREYTANSNDERLAAQKKPIYPRKGR